MRLKDSPLLVSSNQSFFLLDDLLNVQLLNQPLFHSSILAYTMDPLSLLRTLGIKHTSLSKTLVVIPQ